MRTTAKAGLGVGVTVLALAFVGFGFWLGKYLRERKQKATSYPASQQQQRQVYNQDASSPHAFVNHKYEMQAERGVEEMATPVLPVELAATESTEGIGGFVRAEKDGVAVHSWEMGGQR